MIIVAIRLVAKLSVQPQHSIPESSNSQSFGHRKIENTLLYINLEEALFKGTVDYISKVAKTENETCKLVEEGFEFVCDFQGSKIFRKRK